MYWLLDAGVTGVHDQFVGTNATQNEDAWAVFGAFQMQAEREMYGELA